MDLEFVKEKVKMAKRGLEKADVHVFIVRDSEFLASQDHIALTKAHELIDTADSILVEVQERLRNPKHYDQGRFDLEVHTDKVFGESRSHVVIDEELEEKEQ